MQVPCPGHSRKEGRGGESKADACLGTVTGEEAVGGAGQGWWGGSCLIPKGGRGAEAGRSLEVRSLRPCWPTWWNCISTKNTKISQVWWYVPVITATQEAEAGELLEPRRWRLQ